ncbi:helix-turn-helix domain-containing protein [Brevibacillus agri]|uniref:helix-turn-helix domain-containing protein n=1 Tax=Brevibacillus agri TaxID=51101 RepID=UPI0024C00A70|nr:helix-turn-helix domain-containing protein [Brevibacillus agri]WHX32966.1 helix-turn-helix domain-containing protein [Brevibacillus agri]
MNSQNSVAEELELLCAVALNAMIPLANERTLQSAYYILRGRKANQTLQDVHLYNLYPYYRMFPGFSKEDWDKIVATLFQKGHLQQREGEGASPKPTFWVTETGCQSAREAYEKYRFAVWFAPFTQFDFASRIETFWQRLHLLVQTVSQMLGKDLGFTPVVTDKSVQLWVKEQLQPKEARAVWTDGLAEELYRLWEPLAPEVQKLLVTQLSGISQVGKTLGQLAKQQQVTRVYLTLLFRYGLAASMQRLMKEAEAFPLLSRLVTRENKLDPRLSDSAARTYAMVQRGWSKAEIAVRRQMKESTVEDHLVEIALRCPEWDESAYLSPETRSVIVAASEALQTSRLRLIKDHVGPAVSYLQIRLALARRQGETNG